MALAGLLFAEPLVAAFRDSDAQLIEIGARALRCQALSFPLLGWITMVNMTLQTARKTRQATIVAISRQGIVFIPVLFIATRLWGLWGASWLSPCPIFSPSFSPSRWQGDSCAAWTDKLYLFKRQKRKAAFFTTRLFFFKILLTCSAYPGPGSPQRRKPGSWWRRRRPRSGW